MMNKREVVKTVLNGKAAAYVPWNCGFTIEAAEKLQEHYGEQDLDKVLDNHFVKLGDGEGFYTDIGNNQVKDLFGVVWDRTIDKDIGTVEGFVLPEPTLEGYEFPNPLNQPFFAEMEEKIEKNADCFRVFKIGFSLYERAWAMRGMENLLMDFILNPDFVHEFLWAIGDYNIAQIKQALKYDIDAIYLGDDWGQQRGLQMGQDMWRQFIKPHLKRMYSVAKEAGKYVTIHCCGKVDELFDDLIEIGLDCFNPFQPEVMDVFALMKKYKGRLAFHGGLSTQQTLPYGTVEDVERETTKLLQAGADGSYIFTPCHAVEGDVPLENMLTFIEILHSQPGYKRG